MQTVKSFGVASVAKTFTVIGAIFGVLTVPLSWIAARTPSGAGAPDISWRAVLSPLHLLLIVGTAAVMGFLYGAIGAVVYNFVARWIGGIEVEL